MKSKLACLTTIGLMVIISKGAFAQTFSIHNNSFQYASAYTDSESHLQYLNARYYAAENMRFASRDSFAFMNRYAYADGNPVMNIDPSGHSSLKADALAEVANALGSQQKEEWLIDKFSAKGLKSQLEKEIEDIVPKGQKSMKLKNLLGKNLIQFIERAPDDATIKFMRAAYSDGAEGEYEFNYLVNNKLYIHSLMQTNENFLIYLYQKIGQRQAFEQGLGQHLILGKKDRIALQELFPNAPIVFSESQDSSLPYAGETGISNVFSK